MTPENEATIPPPPAGMSEISRLTGVFFEPGKTFEDIAQRPTFIVPLLLVMVFSLVYMTFYSQHVGWERQVRHQIETSKQAAQQTPEQREQAIQIGAKFAPIVGYAIPIIVPVIYVIISAVLLGVVKIMSAPTTFKQVFAVMSYSGITGIVFMLLAIAVMFMKSPDDFDLQNPLAFNLGAALDPNGSKFLYTLGTSLDVFVIWRIILIALGLKAAGGKNMSFTGALMAVLIPWLLWILCAAALAGLRG